MSPLSARRDSFACMNYVELGDLLTLSLATLIHAFITSRIDYRNAIFAGAPKCLSVKLQRVLNTAARVVSGTKTFDRDLTHLMHAQLHWLDIPDHVSYKIVSS